MLTKNQKRFTRSHAHAVVTSTTGEETMLMWVDWWLPSTVGSARSVTIHRIGPTSSRRDHRGVDIMITYETNTRPTFKSMEHMRKVMN